MGSEWDSVVKEWLIDGGQCTLGGIADKDGAVYAAAADDDNGWDRIVKADHDEEVLLEDESTSTITIREFDTIKQAMDEGKAPNGLWIGGVKFTITVVERDFEYNDCKFDLIFCRNKVKGGLQMVKTEQGSIVLAIFDEEKEQNAPNARSAALAFAEFIASAEG